MRIAVLTILVLLAAAAPATATTQRATRDRTPPKLTVSGVGGTVTSKAFRAGLTVRVAADEPVAAAVELLAPRRGITIPRLPDLVLAERPLGFAAGARTVRLVPRRGLPGGRPGHARLRVVAYDAAGNLSAETIDFSVR